MSRFKDNRVMRDIETVLCHEFEMPTLREEIAIELTRTELSARDLAEIFGLRVRDVISHLEHIRRSHKKHFRIDPAICTKCDFVFDTRERLGTPSRCPKCRNERITDPRFTIRQ